MLIERDPRGVAERFAAAVIAPAWVRVVSDHVHFHTHAVFARGLAVEDTHVLLLQLAVHRPCC